MSDPSTFNVDHGAEPVDTASERARASFKLFWRELSWEYRRIIPGLGMSAVKMPFATDSDDPQVPSHEQMWVSDILFDGETITGTLMNTPNFVQAVVEGDTVSRPLSDISDWMYVMSDKVYGGYTVQMIRAGMDEAERRGHDEAWGLDFGSPDMVRLVPDFGAEAPAPPPAKKGIMGRIFGSKTVSERGDFIVPVLSEPDLTGLPEHAMSENSGASIAGQLAEDPGLATYVDEDGWTLLQRDALAGNLAPVEVMLAAGFDPHAPNSNGHSALDLAKRMGWTRIVDAITKRVQ